MNEINMQIGRMRRLLPFGLLPVAALILALQPAPASESGQPGKMLNEPVNEAPAQRFDRSFESFAPAVIEVLRNGSVRPLCVTIRHAPNSDRLARTDRTPYEQNPGALEGVFLGELNSELRRKLKIPRDVHGALVFDLYAYSLAAQVGLRPGDVIQSINRQEVGNAGEALRLTQNAKDRRALLRVWGNGGSHFLLVDPSQSG